MIPLKRANGRKRGHEERSTGQWSSSRFSVRRRLVSKGVTQEGAAAWIGASTQTLIRWWKKHFEMRTDLACRPNELDGRNVRLKRLLTGAELVKAMSRDAASGNFRTQSSNTRRSSMRDSGWPKSPQKCRFCPVLHQPCNKQRRKLVLPCGGPHLVLGIVELSKGWGLHGYR